MVEEFKAKSIQLFIDERLKSDTQDRNKISFTHLTKVKDKEFITKIYRTKSRNDDEDEKCEAAKNLIQYFCRVHKWFTEKQVEKYNLMYLVDFTFNPDIQTYFITYEKKKESLLDLIRRGERLTEDGIRKLVKDLLTAFCYLYREEKADMVNKKNKDREEECIVHTYIAPEHILYEDINGERKYYLGGLEYCVASEALSEEAFEPIQDYLKTQQRYHPCNFDKIDRGERDKVCLVTIGMICHALYTGQIPKGCSLELEESEEEEYKNASGQFKSFMQYCMWKAGGGKIVYRLEDLLEHDFVKENYEATPVYFWVPKRFKEVKKFANVLQVDLYQCTDTRTGNSCVRKVIKNPNKKKDVEGKILLELNKSNNGFVPEYIDSFMLNEFLNIIIEYFNGSSLADFMTNISKSRALYFAETTLVSWNVARALKAMHDKKIMHRDVKLENILTQKGLDNEFYVRDANLSDFDVSKMFELEKSNNTIVGTLYYKAPEIHDIVVGYNESIDIWGFGAVLFNMFTMGKRKEILEHPTPENIAHALEVLKNEFIVEDFEKFQNTTNTCVKNGYIELIENCLNYKSEDRYNINQVVNSLENIIGKLDIEQHKYNLSNSEKSAKDIIPCHKKTERGIILLRFAGVSPYIAEIYNVTKVKDGKFEVHRELLIGERNNGKELTLQDAINEPELYRNPADRLTSREILSVLLDVAKGIKYIHGREIVLRGLKPSIIYVIKKKDTTRAKIAMRFDLLKIANRGNETEIDELYVAPELNNPYREIHCGSEIKDEEGKETKPEIIKKADIWSFGKIIGFIIKARDGFIRDINVDIKAIIEDCICEKPEKRLTSTELVERMKSLCIKHGVSIY